MSPEAGADDESSGSRGWRYSVSVASFRMPDTDLERGGSTDLTTYHLQARAERQLEPAFTVAVTMSYDDYRRRFTGSEGFAALRPWGNSSRLALSASLLAHVSARWSYGLRPYINTFSETGDVTDDTLNYGTSIAAVSRVAPDRRIGLGARLSRGLDGTVDVTPFVVVDWRFNDRWRLANPSEPDLAGNAGLELLYTPGERWRFAAVSVYHSSEFRLDDQGVAPGGIGEHDGFLGFVRVDRGWASGLKFKGYVGALFDGTLEVENAEGETVAKSDYDTMPLAGLALEQRF